MMKSIIAVVMALFMATMIYADAKAAAKAEISKQYDLLKKGDLAQLKTRFTDRQKKRITAEKVKKARDEIKNYAIDDLVASVIEGDYQGKKTIKIKMKNGRTLTTLIQEGSEWRSDTIWFR